MSALEQAPALNRTRQAAFLTDLQAALATFERCGQGAGLLLVQLQSVGELNLTFGYRVVDTVIVEVARRLADGFGARGRVVCIGTRRFALLLPGLKSPAHALLAAKKVERLLDPPMQTGGQRIKIDVAQGIALYPSDARTAEQFMQCAEVALTVARDSDLSFALYGATGTSELLRLQNVDATLTNALEQGGITPYLQPQIDLRSGRPAGAEALLRCKDPTGAFIPPEALIQVAERTRRLPQVTAAVLNTALRYAAEWPKLGCALSVNVSTQSLKDSDLVPSIASALGIWGWEPQHLTVEVTESAFMDEPEKSFATMRELRKLGVRVSIDDFGTGYSSLAYFKNIPANELKVDKSFVLNMLGNDADRRIVQSVIGLAHAFDLEVVAEGVEDAPTLEALRAMGCDLAQGYWVGKPMTAPEFLAWLDGCTDQKTARNRSRRPVLRSPGP
jgi:diguanylate cyclase (GGDEF)-like protein